MSEAHSQKPARSAAVEEHLRKSAIGSFILTGFAFLLAPLCLIWIEVTIADAALRGALDGGESFAINIGLDFQIAGACFVAMILLAIAAGSFLGWVRESAWLPILGFSTSWLASVAAIGLVAYSRLHWFF